MWRVLYESPMGATLELVLDRFSPEWHLTLKPPRATDDAGKALDAYCVDPYCDRRLRER